MIIKLANETKKGAKIGAGLAPGIGITAGAGIGLIGAAEYAAIDGGIKRINNFSRRNAFANKLGISREARGAFANRYYSKLMHTPAGKKYTRNLLAKAMGMAGGAGLLSGAIVGAGIGAGIGATVKHFRNKNK